MLCQGFIQDKLPIGRLCQWPYTTMCIFILYMNLCYVKTFYRSDG